MNKLTAEADVGRNLVSTAERLHGHKPEKLYAIANVLKEKLDIDPDDEVIPVTQLSKTRRLRSSKG